MGFCQAPVECNAVDYSLCCELRYRIKGAINPFFIGRTGGMAVQSMPVSSKSEKKGLRYKQPPMQFQNKHVRCLIEHIEGHRSVLAKP
jgi:hypothetical protein